METEQNQMAERILDLTLEIIYLLTGEDNIYVKKTPGAGQNPILVSLHSILIPERNNEQKILEVTKKIIDLLNEESGNWRNFNINIKKEIKEEEDEEWEYLEGHKDLHMDIKMEDQPPLTSPDGSSNGNPPERCSSPLYSQDSTPEDHNTPDQDQWVEVFDIKTEVKEKVTEEEEEEEEEDEEEEGEEMYMSGNQLSIKDSEIMVTITKEESSPDDRTGGHNVWSNPAGRVILSAEPKKEDNGTAQHAPVAGIVSPNIVHKPNHVVRSADQQTGIILWNPNINHILVPQVSNQAFIVQINPSNSDLGVQQRKNANEKPFSCSECQKSFANKSHLIQHQRVHTGEKPFSCSECGKCFSNRGNRDKHVRVHTGERPFSCTECGKRFAQKVTLIIHQKTHARRMIYSRTHTL